MSKLYPPTLPPEVHELLALLKQGIQTTLGESLVGLYLDGSLARGGFDSASDIDFVAVTESELSPEQFQALHDLHMALGQQPHRLALDIEGFYVSREAVRRYNPRHARFANLERGPGEQLKWVDQDQYWDVHRSVLREYGRALLGPPPASLIDPISPDGLRRTMGSAIEEWGGYVLGRPQLVSQPGYQPYAVLTICRMLYTLNQGEIAAKKEAAAWALESLPARWQPLITQALHDRLQPGSAPTPALSAETLAFLQFAAQTERGYWGRKFCEG